jgi:hypothetical protein
VLLVVDLEPTSEPVTRANIRAPFRVHACGIVMPCKELFCSYPSKRGGLVGDGIPGVIRHLLGIARLLSKLTALFGSSLF